MWRRREIPRLPGRRGRDARASATPTPISGIPRPRALVYHGRDSPGGRIPDDFGVAVRLGTIYLVLILFDGGMNTPWDAIRRVAVPAGILATVGVALTADVTAVRVRGDLDAAGLALRNLVENALVHGEGGHWIRVSCRREQGGIVVAVTDDGPGVPSDDLPTLAQRFKRAGNTAGVGAGLGLAIVAMLARRMRARLGLKSPPQGLAAGFEARLTWPASGEPGH